MDKYMSTAADWACPSCNNVVKGSEMIGYIPYHICGFPDGVTSPQPNYTPLLTRIADTLECIAGLLDSAERAAITEAGRAVEEGEEIPECLACDDPYMDCCCGDIAEGEFLTGDDNAPAS